MQIDTDDEEEVKDFIDLLKEYSPAGKDQDKKRTPVKCTVLWMEGFHYLLRQGMKYSQKNC